MCALTSITIVLVLPDRKHLWEIKKFKFVFYGQKHWVFKKKDKFSIFFSDRCLPYWPCCCLRMILNPLISQAGTRFLVILSTHNWFCVSFWTCLDSRLVLTWLINHNSFWHICLDSIINPFHRHYRNMNLKTKCIKNWN